MSLFFSENFTFLLNLINIGATIYVPTHHVWILDEPITGISILFFALILWFKLVSYAHTNYDLRRATVHKLDYNEIHQAEVENVRDTTRLRYPYNLTFSNFYYYWCAPTLCYQLNFPRSEKIRVTYVLSLIVRIIFITFINIFLIEQYAHPIIKTAMEPIHNFDLYTVSNH